MKKFYVAPEMEVEKVELDAQLLACSPQIGGSDNIGVDDDVIRQ